MQIDLLQVPAKPNCGKMSPAKFADSRILSIENIEHWDRMVASLLVIVDVLLLHIFDNIFDKLPQISQIRLEETRRGCTWRISWRWRWWWRRRWRLVLMMMVAGRAGGGGAVVRQHYCCARRIKAIRIEYFSHLELDREIEKNNKIASNPYWQRQYFGTALIVARMRESLPWRPQQWGRIVRIDSYAQSIYPSISRLAFAVKDELLGVSVVAASIRVTIAESWIVCRTGVTETLKW